MIDLGKYSSAQELANDLAAAICSAVKEAEDDVNENFDDHVLKHVRDLNRVQVNDIMRSLGFDPNDDLKRKKVEHALRRLAKAGKVDCYRFTGDTWIETAIRATDPTPKPVRIYNSIMENQAKEVTTNGK